MYYLGLDVGSSSIKAALVEAKSGKSILSVHEPKNEMSISSLKNDWAEQDPNVWWNYTCTAIKRVCKESNIDPKKIISIGISYQMHGLVIVDKNGEPLRDSIIWCDSRAVNIGSDAYEKLGEDKCMSHLLNSPGNFTASKLKWVKENEPEVYEKIYKYMLPGDFIAYKLTGEINTTRNGLSEGIIWDYKNNETASWLLDFYGINPNLTPDLVDNFTNQGATNSKSSEETGLNIGIPITYRAGDQPNNALALNVFDNGEVAASGGTSGVIYSITKDINSKEPSRINHFAHVNYNDNNNLIFVDFTADWCVTCQFNKITTLDNKKVIRFFLENDVKLIRGDWTKKDEKILNFIKKYERFGVPVNIIYSKNMKEGFVLPEILSKSNIIDNFERIK